MSRARIKPTRTLTGLGEGKAKGYRVDERCGGEREERAPRGRKNMRVDERGNETRRAV